MTNEIRQKEIIEKFGKYVAKDGLVKTNGNGWQIIINPTQKKLIELNKGSNVVISQKGPKGLAEAYIRLKQLVKQLPVETVESKPVQK